MQKIMNKRKLRGRAVAAIVIIICVAITTVYFVLRMLNMLPNAVQNSSSNRSSLNGSSLISSSKPVFSAVDLSLLLLVNKDNIIPPGYTPNLGKIPSKYYTSSDKDNRFDIIAALSLESMIDTAAKDGIELKIVSGYRTYEFQQSNFQKKINSFLSQGYSSLSASSAAAQLVAPPGTSEHETGLAADIINPGWYAKHSDLTADFDQTDAFKWLDSHCADYGFILRYLKDKTDVTKYSYEPWHYRYVGVNNANNIMTNGLCLEEYLKELGK